jgi:hypothetical protein
MSDTDQAPEAEASKPELPIQQAIFNVPGQAVSKALPYLRQPFTPGAVKWKIQSTWPKGKPAEGAIIVGYIDARLVSARLNKVVGGNWSEKPIRVEGQSNALLCELTVFDQTHTDLGVGQGHTDEMKLKAVHSDALKRPAVKFGIGESLYAMPEFRLAVTEDGAERSDGTPTIKRRKDGKPSGLREPHLAYLRKCYEDWLRREGEAAFGAPLDHGDAAEGSVGEAEAEESGPSEASEPLDDDKAKALGGDARKLRDEIRAIDDGALPAQSFDAAMGQREHSHERLEDFVGNLTELLADVRRFDELQTELAGVLEDEADWKKIIDRAQRRASRRERVEVLEKALAEAKGDGDA